MVTRDDQAGIPWEVSGRPQLPTDVILTVSRNHKVFLSSTCIQGVETKVFAPLTVHLNKKSIDLMTNYLSIYVLRRLPSGLMSPYKNNCGNGRLKWEIQWFDDKLFIHTCMTSSIKWSDVTGPWAEGPSLYSISQELHLPHKKPEYEQWFMPYLFLKKIALTSPAYLSSHILLLPELCIIWGFLSGPGAFLNCSYER